MNDGVIHWGLGQLPPSVELPREYFDKRGCVLDCRGPLVIAKGSHWGFGVRVLTESHDIGTWPALGPVVSREVRVDRGAWIGSYSVLVGCHIGEGAVVAAGTVVRGQNVAPSVMVAGNPARVIARWTGNQWEYLPGEQSHYERDLR